MARTHRTARKSTGRLPVGQLAPRNVPQLQESQPDIPQEATPEEEPFEIELVVPESPTAQDLPAEEQQPEDPSTEHKTDKEQPPLSDTEPEFKAIAEIFYRSRILCRHNGPAFRTLCNDAIPLCRQRILDPMKISAMALNSTRSERGTSLILYQGAVVMPRCSSKAQSLPVRIGDSASKDSTSSASRYIFSGLVSLGGGCSSSVLSSMPGSSGCCSSTGES
jgi:hypothetical protein